MDAVVLVAGHRYGVDFDVTSRRIVFARGAVTDDADGRPLATPFAVGVDEPLIDASDHDAGFALSGDPDVALADRAVPHLLSVSVAADGYRPATVVVTIPAAPVLPVDAPVVLRRMPLRLTGRVMAAATGAPVAGARIFLTGPSLPAPARALLLSSPLAAGLTSGAVVQGRVTTPVASPVPVKTARAAPAGATAIVLDDVQGLAAGQLLRCGPAERSHWVRVAGAAGPGNVVPVTAPLAVSLREGDPVAPFNLGAVMGPAAAPVGAALAGEAVVIVDAMVAGDVLAITDPPAPARYHGVGIMAGPSGDYAIAGLVRLGAARLAVTAPGFAGQNRLVPLKGAGFSPALDWRLLP